MWDNIDSSNRLNILRQQVDGLIRERTDLTSDSSADVVNLSEGYKIDQDEQDIRNQELRCAWKELSVLCQDYERLYELASCGYVTLDAGGAITRANLAAADLLASEKTLLLLSDFSVFITPDFQYTYREALEKGRKTGERQSIDLALKRNGGPPVWVQAEIDSDRDEAGALAQWRIVLTNITERRRSEETREHNNDELEFRFKERTSRVAELEKRLRLIADTVDDVFWLRDTDNGRMIFVSPAYERIWNRPLKELLKDPKSFLDSVHPADRDLIHKAKQKNSQGLPAELEYRILLPDGSVRWIRDRGAPVRDENGHIFMIVGTARDITSSKEAEIEMRHLNESLRREIEQRRGIEEDLKAHQKKLLQENAKRKLLSKRLVDLLEVERQEIASALHDDLGRMLTGTNMELESLKEHVGSERSALSAIGDAQAGIREAMVYVRDVSRRLRPDVLDHLGLVAALTNLIDSMKSDKGPQIHLFVKRAPDMLQHHKELAVYRIAQEALTNALKHAGATHIFINLVTKDEWLTLTVEDDGVGFDKGREQQMFTARGTLGLLIIQERVRQVRGTFELESQIGKGTLLLVEIPLN